jgi:hypothetical protein
VALLEPNDPSGRQQEAFSPGFIIVAKVRVDVTEIIGSGKVDMGFKAMIHTLAVSSFPRLTNLTSLTLARRKPVTSQSHPSDLYSMSHSQAWCISSLAASPQISAH